MLSRWAMLVELIPVGVSGIVGSESTRTGIGRAEPQAGEIAGPGKQGGSSSTLRK